MSNENEKLNELEINYDLKCSKCSKCSKYSDCSKIKSKTRKVVCFMGVSGSGKNHQTNLLKKKGYIEINFADELRNILWDTIGYKPKNYNKAKQCIVGLDAYPIWVSKILKKIFPLLPTIRELLQNLGTEAMRSREPNFWCELWLDKVNAELEKGNDVVCSDLRFINELKYTQFKNKAEFEIIFCDYVSDRYDCENNHSSEKLAQYLLSLDCPNLRVLSKKDIEKILKEYSY